MIGEVTAHLWQSTWFGIAAGLMTLAFRKNRAKVRYGLWLAASLKFLLPFSPAIGLGSHLGWTPAVHRIALPEVSFAVERIAEPFAGRLAQTPQAAGRIDWTGIGVVGVWALGVAAMAAIRLRGWRRIRRAVRASKPVEMAAAIEIRSSPGLIEPGVVGMWRPVLLLPDGIGERLMPAELEAVLAHELCHVRRRDNLSAAIHMLVEAVFWFHPMVWWIGARLVEERERACDEGVLSLGSEPRVYAGAILNVCRLYAASPLRCVPGVTGANLKRRIEAIMLDRRGQGLNGAKKLLLVAAGAAALAAPVAVGILTSAGKLPVIHAQAPAAAVPAQAVPAQAAPQVATPPAAAGRYAGHRLLAMLFDLDTMAPEERARARQAAVEFLHRKLEPADLVTVLTVDRGRLAVLQDFTGDRAVLEPAILKSSALDGSSVDAGMGQRLWTIEAAARLLAPIAEKKALLVFSSRGAPAYDESALRHAIETVKDANLAIYVIDTGSQGAPASAPQNEAGRRRTYAEENFGSAQSAMGRTYIRYGPPDQIEERGGSGQERLQVWRYHYLDNFRSSVEFEFTPGNRPTGVRINWPPPVATYEGVAGTAAGMAEALGWESRDGGRPAAGLPGRRATLAIYPAGEAQALTVPLEGLAGTVDIAGQIKSRLANGAAGPAVAAVRDNVAAAAGSFQASFLLPAGAYDCELLVRERATGRTYGETIHFEVK